MLKRQLGTLFLVAFLILTTTPAVLGVQGTTGAHVAVDGSGNFDYNREDSYVQRNQTSKTEEMETENLTLTDNQTTTNETAVMGIALEQEGKTESSYAEEDTTVTEPEEEVETENVTDYIIDNRLREASPNTVYKEKSYLDVGDRPGIGRYRELILFDLSEYNNAENISNATLSLFWFYPNGKERPKDTVIEVYRPAAAWNPENVTWNSKDNGYLWTQPGGDWFDRNRVAQGNAPYATITLKAGDLPDNRYYELNVTDLVKEYVSDRHENTGFLIKTRNESADYVAFYSGDAENEEQHPKLSIEI